MIMYVRRNEETSYLKIVHFVDEERGVPSELEANAKSSFPHLCDDCGSLTASYLVLDEAFPEITIDLVNVF